MQQLESQVGMRTIIANQCLLLQAYINVDSIDQVKDRDNLTITQPSAVLSSDGFDSSSTQSVPVPSQNKIKVATV